jgi:hypothetical protein
MSPNVCIVMVRRAAAYVRSGRSTTTGSCYIHMLSADVAREQNSSLRQTRPVLNRGYNAMPRYVVSTTLVSDDLRWPATVLRSLDDVATLKATDGGPIAVHGSATLGERDVLERPAGTAMVASARCFHHAVGRQERSHDQCSHVLDAP